ncbi:MAG: SH3 domain-containing protein, partial [Anaerolineae bacterium]|nr:SH3 domain-containing protein [Anaerolineae bacterium]
MKPAYYLYWRKAAIGASLAAMLIAPAHGVAQSPAPLGVNLFTNPGHEHPGAYFGGRGELNVSWNWTPFWEEPPAGTDLRDANYRTPEFRPTFARDYPYRINSGGGADHWFNFYALNRAAGIMQVVEGLQVGQPLRYTSWVSLWSSNDNDPAIPPASSRDGNMQIRACIQQDGSPRNMVSKELVCSPWAQPYDKWHQISVDATAKNSKVLAFVQSRAAVPVQHNDAYVDDSCFEILPNHGAAGICLGQAFVPTGSSQGTRQPSAPIPPAPVAASERQNGSAYVNLPGFPSSITGATNTSSSPAAAPPSASASAPVAIGEIKANVPALNVRRGQSFQSDILGTISQNEALPALEQIGAWWKVSFKGETAYVSAPLVSFKAAAATSPSSTAAPVAAQPSPATAVAINNTGTIKPKVPVLNVRRGPGAQHAIVGTIETLSLIHI